MIIELFGPPGVGKTTFAHALAARLRGHEIGAKLALSYRPSEIQTDAGAGGSIQRWFPALRRVTRPARESVVAIGRLPRNSMEASAASTLRKLFPPNGIVAALKLRQYLLRLSCAWHDAVECDDIVIFDQAFVQLICTLVSLAPAATSDQLDAALEAVPRPNLLIGLSAPLDILKARLAERSRRMSKIENLLELDLQTNLGSHAIADRVRDLLQERNRLDVRIETSDCQALLPAVDKVEQLIVGVHAHPTAPTAAAFEGAA